MSANATLPEERWLSITDFAVENKMSISTLRRRIKANRIPFKLENGKYFLKEELDHEVQFFGQEQNAWLDRVAKLEREVQKAKEEITELKMLLSLYEDKLATKI